MSESDEGTILETEQSEGLSMEVQNNSVCLVSKEGGMVIALQINGHFSQDVNTGRWLRTCLGENSDALVKNLATSRSLARCILELCHKSDLVA